MEKPTELTAPKATDCENFKYYANTIMKQIKYPNIWVFGSWGAHNFVWGASKDKENNPALSFKVNGRKFKGYVHIFYDWMDYYRIEFVSTHGNLKKVVNEVYFDMLQEIIDDYVEKIPEYAF